MMEAMDLTAQDCFTARWTAGVARQSTNIGIPQQS